MKRSISIVQLGSEEWEINSTISDKVDLSYLKIFNAEKIDLISMSTVDYILLSDDSCIYTRNIDITFLKKVLINNFQIKLIYNNNSENLSRLIKNDFQLEKFSLPINYSEPNCVIKYIINYLDPERTTNNLRFKLDSIDISSDNFEFDYLGNSQLEIKNLNLNSQTQILSWRYSIPYKRETLIEFSLEHQKDKSLNIYLLVVEHDIETDSILSTRSYEISSSSEPILFERDKDVYLSVSLLARGSGNFSCSNLYIRKSRHRFGYYLVNSSKIIDDNNQEIFFYFNPGNLTPPLNIYFSGYKTFQGFEGEKMMPAFDRPYLLVSDERLEGGAFYRGSEKLQEKVLSKIQSYMSSLNFTEKQIIVTGLSMGTHGAVFYGTLLKARYIVIGKPILSLKNVNESTRISRPEDFLTGLDTLNYIKSFSNKNVKQIDEDIFKNIMKLGSYEGIKTTIYVCYMINDEYDKSAVESLEKYTSNIKNNVSIIKKGFLGRHNDETNKVVRWFIRRTKQIIENNY